MEILPNRAPNHMSVKLEPEIVLLPESDSDEQDDYNFTPEKIEVVPELVALGDDDDDDDDYYDDTTYNTSVDGHVVNYGSIILTFVCVVSIYFIFIKNLY